MEVDKPLDAERFKRLFRNRILLAWNIPPVFGLGFILFIQVLTPGQMFDILTTPLEPGFIIAWMFIAVWYLGRRVRPVVEYLKGNKAYDAEVALRTMQRFPLHFWSTFLIYLVLAPSSVILAAEIYSNLVSTPEDWFRIHLVALIVSIIVGLPIFFSILDLFGHVLHGISLRKAHVTLKAKVFLIGALVPLLIDTMIVQYYWTRTGYFTYETFIVWLVLELLAIAGSLLFMRSIGQSLAPLKLLVDKHNQLAEPELLSLSPRSTDEIGVLISDHRDLLENLQVQREVLEFRNRLLRQGSTGRIDDAVDSVLELSQRAIDCDHVFIFMLDEKHESMRVTAKSGWGYREDGHIVIDRDENTIMHKVRRVATVVRVDDSSREQEINRDLCNEFNIHSLLAAPLIIEGRVSGALVASSRHRHHFDDRDESLLNGLAQETAVILQTHMLEKEREAANEARLEREARISLLLDSTAEAIFGVDLEGRCTFVNRACVEMLGYDSEEALLGENMHALIHHTRPDGTPYPKEECRVWRATLAGLSEHCDEELHFRKDGSSFPVEYWSHPIHQGGEIIGTVVTFVDISERKLAEQALRLSEERYALAQKAAHIGSWEWKVGSDELFWSETIEPMFGMQSGEFTGSFDDYLKRVHPDDVQRLQLKLDELMRSGDEFEIEHRVIWPDRSIHWIAGTARLYRDKQGNPERLVGIVQDITERYLAAMELKLHRHKLEELVEERTRELRLVNQELESFSYSVSHDLRAPLRAIDGFSQALLEDYAAELDGEGADYLDRVRRSAQRMGRLIDDMLQLSRVSRRELKPTEVDLTQLAHEVVEELRRQEPERQVEVHIEPGLTARADAGLLQILLMNLIGNAWKFTSQADAPRIEVSRRGTDRGEAFIVADNGAGFDMRHIEKLFGAFQRLHRMDEFEGTGIGLATVQRIINRHGGSIWAEGEPGRGARFYFQLNSNENESVVDGGEQSPEYGVGK